MNNVYKTTEERETKPAISVIIPVYNSEKYLEETLNSILNQTFSDIEIICIDDGSTDNSLAVLNRYKEQDNRIKVISQKNQGVVTARNNAIKEAQGEFIYLLDSDDIVDKTVLEKSYNAIMSDKGDVITCRVWAFGLLNEEIKYWLPNKINMTRCNCLPNAALFRKSLFEQSGGFDSAFDKGIEDYDFYLNLMYRQKARFYRIPEILFFYRIKLADESRDKQVVGAVKKELWDTLYKKYPEMRIYRSLFKIKKVLTGLLRNIFSVCNERKNGIKRKVITVLGVKLKIRVDDVRRKIINTEIVKNKIVFNNFNGKGYGCNPKYVAEEIIKQKLPYELVWLVKNKEAFREEFPKEIKLVEYTIDNAIKEFSSAKVWISNQRMPNLYENGLFKKKEQFYIQTWHGWTPIKQIEKDVEYEKPWWCKWAKIDSRYIDLLTASSKFDKNRLLQCFYFNGEISDVGLPRNDVFYVSDEQKAYIKNKIYSKYQVKKDHKILLYAPTFRDDGRLDAYDVDLSSCVKTLESKYKSNYTVLVRLHPNVQKQAKDCIDFKDYIDVTLYPDVMELLIASDVMITDYSCLMFEFMHTRKPVFLYGYDINKYVKERGFYIDIKSLMFPFAQTNHQLIQNIKNFDKNLYLKKVEDFIKESGSSDDGKASRYIVNRIKGVIENDK